MTTDPIADLLTRIRNAMSAHHESANAPYSKMKENILKVLKKEEFIEDYKIQKEEGPMKTLIIALKEDRAGMTLKRVSSPGQRIYVKRDELKAIKSGLGVTILSTSKGIMTNYEARKQNLGGELLCEVY